MTTAPGGLFSGQGTAGAGPSSKPMPPPAMTTEPARTYQHYQVLRRADGALWELGRGAMGITYKAFDVNLRCEVALKVVNAAMLNHANARERFVREARAAARLRHRNVATVHHLGSDGEQFFYAMEFIDGETLEALVRRAGPLPPVAALRVVLQTARALAAASRQNLVHRDIKPANLMLVHEDDDDHAVVKVIDFGLARPTVGDGSGTLTLGGFVGTPQYASPEQLEEEPVDARSDIYSLGITLWFLLAGQPPFTGSLAGICDQHRQSPPPWHQLPESTPQTVRDLLAHMLEKNPAKRPQDPLELRREVEACLAHARGIGAAAAAPPEEHDGDDIFVSPVTAALADQLGGDTKEPTSLETAATQTGAAPRQPDSSAEEVMPVGRYEIVRQVGEGARGRVFQARDRSVGGRLVALRQLHSELLAAPGAFERLDGLVRRVRNAPHPHLARILALEPFSTPTSAMCLVEEWLNGFTLLDLLAMRGGGLAISEALRLLQQTAAAADHARGKRLARLDLSLHQLRLQFPKSPADFSAQPNARAAMQAPMDEWPAWALKLDPLAGAMDRAPLADQPSDVTILTGASTLVEADAAAHEPPTANATVRALARLTYELLGGTPLPPGTAANHPGTAARANRYVSLAAVNEAANAVLRQALSPEPGFENGARFFADLTRAAGFQPETLSSAAPSRDGGSNGVSTMPAPKAAVLPVNTPRYGGPAARRKAADNHNNGMAAVAYPTEDTPTFAGNIAALPVGRREREASARRRRFWVFAVIWALILCVGAAAMVWRQRGIAKQNRRLETAASAAATPGTRKSANKEKERDKEKEKDAAAAVSPAPSPRKLAVRPMRVPTTSTPKSTPQPTPKPLPAVINGNASSGNSAAAIASTPAPSSSVAAPAESLPPSSNGNRLSGASASSTPPERMPEPSLSASSPALSDPPAVATASAPPSLAVAEPPPEEPRRLSVRVSSSPEGAEIYSEGKLLGRTPAEIQLTPGKHEIVAHRRNYEDIHYVWPMSADKPETTVHIRLMEPGQVPIGPPAETAAESARESPSRREGSRPSATAVRRNAESVAVPVTVPVLPAQPVNGRPPPALPAESPRIMRALPRLDPFNANSSAAPESVAPAESSKPAPVNRDN